jgi:arylsulfatase A
VFLRTNEITIARLLKSAGYHTAHIGKWHCISKFNGAEATPGDHGFDYWFSTQNNAVPSHEDPVNFVRNGKRVGPLKGNSSTLIMDEALQYLERTGKEPFLAMIWFHAPHEKISTPEEFTKKYPDVEDPTKRIYYGSVSLVDHEIGRLLKYLDDHNLRGNTLVVFTSDNGPETLRRYVGAERSHGSPGPLRGMKLHITEGGYRVPGIIRWPGHTRAGANSEEPVNNTDFLPTFCQIAGVEIPRDRVIDGASIVPVFSGQPIERQTPLYWEYDFAISTPWTISLRDGQWKLLGNATLDQFELYDLTADVGEAKNVATKFPARVAKMSAEMKRLHREIFEEGARSGNPLPARAVKK